MQRKNIILILCLLSAVVFTTILRAAESDLLNQISSQVEQHPVVRAEFTQTKKMQALKRPLVTVGQLTYTHSQGVLWQILQPYHVSYVLSEDKIIEIDANGLRKVRGLTEVPGLAQVGRVFRAMLGADISTLHSYFDVTAQGAPGKWSLTLKPRQPQIAKYLSLIQLSGSNFIETIVISEAAGDSASIRFLKTQGAISLSESESQLFGIAPVSNTSLEP